ncbi:unnamed protein product [Ectocarpus sp. CCAP 1310/34]|nr:unnamed protein product [Ectocarpus sp. CCAP 1310/34]
MQLSLTQLAAAASAPAGKAVKELVCFDTSSAIGALPTLALARVCTSEGTSLERKDEIALFTTMLTLVLALGQGTQETMEDVLRGAETQEYGSTGAIAARKAFGARAFMGEVVEVLRDFVKETDTYVVLPAMPSSGKAPARESGAAPPAPAPEATAAPAAAAAVPVAAAVPAAAAPAAAAAAAASASAAPAPAAAPATAGASSSAIATAQQQQAANYQVMMSADEAYMKVVQAESGNAEVRSAFLKFFGLRGMPVGCLRGMTCEAPS